MCFFIFVYTHTYIHVSTFMFVVIIVREMTLRWGIWRLEGGYLGGAGVRKGKGNVMKFYLN